MNETIRYFSMFTGVGGFELGLESAGNRNAQYQSQEENLSNPKGDKPISQRQQERINNQSDNRETESSKDTSRALFQNGQIPSNPFSTNLGSIKGNIGFGQQIRQTSLRILREGNGIRDDKKSVEFRENSPNSKQFQCVGFSEIDKYANQLLKKRFPDIPNFGDCTKINPDKLPDFDMLCGGFPCQSFSIAGKRRGFEDTRGTMFFEVARILKIKRPKIVFLENVKGLLNHNKGETFSVILETLDELGYETQWMVLNSKFFGVPQNRERVFIIGSLRGEPRPEILPFGGIHAEDIKESEKPSATITSNYYKSGNADPYILHNVYGGFGEGIRESKDTIPTIRTPKGGGHLPMIAQPVQLVNKNRAEKPYNPDNREMKFKIRDDETSYTVKQAAHEFMVAIVHNTQTRSPNRPSLLKNPNAGGSGHIMKKDETYCLDSGNNQAVQLDYKIRRLTPIECERLQGFPDNWTEGFSDTQRYKMMGNAVTVNVIKAIAEKL